MDDILVSVCCCTYNHEPYIRDCLEGFVKQKPDFPVEYIIHDDASNDKTPRIVLEYAKAYPDKIFPILQGTNQYSQGVDPFSQIVLPRAKGKYIALCEGDDYWIDSLKLQKQVDFLEKNEKYGLCCSASRVFSQKEQRYVGVKGSSLCERYETIIQGFNDINTATVLFKTELIKSCYNELNGFLPQELLFDTALWYWFSYYEFVKFMPDQMAVYRVLEESACHTQDERKRLELDLRFLKLKLYFLSRYQIKRGQESAIIDDLDKSIRDLCDYSRSLGEKKVRESRTFRIGHLIKSMTFWKGHK